MKDRKQLSFWGNLLESVIIGAIVGAIVGVYQRAMEFTVKGSQYMYSSRNPWLIVAMVLAVAVLSVANYFITKKYKGVVGTGVPHMETAIHRDHEINWKGELPLMFFNSLASGFVGLPLGSEGPSVVMGGKAAQMVEDIGKAGEEDTIVMAFGTGFGCAVLSPLAGVSYIFEEALKKFNVKYLVRGIAMMVTAFLVTSLINHHRLLHVENVVLLPFKSYYVFAFLIVVNVILGALFVRGLIATKGLFDKHPNNFFVKYSGFFIFALMLVLNFVCLSYMGSGTSIIGSIASYKSIWLILGLLAFRFVITILAGSSRVTGGLVVPTLAFGALGGQIVCLVCNNHFGMPTDSNGVIILISMCVMFSVINRTPVTATVLFYSAIANSAGDYISVLQMVPMTAVAIVLATWASKLLVKGSMYHLLMELDEPHSHHQTTEQAEVTASTLCSPQTEQVEDVQ